MTHVFEEKLLSYEADQLMAWKTGDKSLMPAFIEKRAIVTNQPAYHFGEAFVLDHYHRTEGWLGFPDYMLMPEVEPNIARHYRGRMTLEQLAPAPMLRELRDARRALPDGRKGYGEPDLFLFKPSGELMFLEVKKEGDTVKDNQLVCLAQIRQHLCCPADVVFLQERRRPRRFTMRYQVDLSGTTAEIRRERVIAHVEGG
ncbi:VRR-NUC domain-containing protein [Anaeromyxobacter diazotrophicus]|uniref:Nuclease n=1 Tax=Anaeromyxobacter diazotrophicus TaxID=2590199 RepID=A0A7I9VJU5_9BACT|nr:VRR-NUC domain-containing protein [Anaeromyxobacter diazotrophicus]GEJ56661.1 nuclease [Anaeromyxobacter diazotrophicus]